MKAQTQRARPRVRALFVALAVLACTAAASPAVQRTVLGELFSGTN